MVNSMDLQGLKAKPENKRKREFIERIVQSNKIEN